MSAQPDSAVELVLAVDAGGTKTAACLADTNRIENDQVLGRGRATSGNPLAVGFDEAMRAIEAATHAARREANQLTAPIARAVLSIAGAANPETAGRIVQWAREVNLADRLAVVSDVLPILAATQEGWGIALIAGTGSVAFGRTADGRSARCGGWGYLLGDDGSGYAIGRAALRQALEDFETAGGPQQPLTTALIRQLQIDTAAALVKAIYGNPNPRVLIASLATQVAMAAHESDPSAQAILKSAAFELAILTARTAKSLGLTAEKFQLAVAGGVLTGSQEMREYLVAQLAVLKLQCEMRIVADPLEGCLRLANSRFPGPPFDWQ